jgi:hypothetical protein
MKFANIINCTYNESKEPDHNEFRSTKCSSYDITSRTSF